MYFEEMPEWTTRHGTQHKSSEVIMWCDENLPEGSFWYCGDREFGFDEEKLKVLFLLRWA